MAAVINRQDVDFLLDEVFDLAGLLTRSRFADYDREAVSAVFDLAEQIAVDHFVPCAPKLDLEEPKMLADRGVDVIPEAGVALRAYSEAGFFGSSFPSEAGGMQMPHMVSTLVSAVFNGANVALANYPFLTAAAANLLNAHGSPEQKAAFLPPMLEGRWFGTMCLSETQAGSSLADIRTKAAETPAGHYLIKGAKMWISGGEHGLSENIVHMVLARIEGAPLGTRGLSLFLVPKFRLTVEGKPGEHNGVTLVGLNHKMGQRGTVNTVLDFGGDRECHGYLIGRAHQGLAHMFHMMNEARLGVGCASVMTGYAGYLYSLGYARDRRQGRQPGNKSPASPQVPIIGHADIKRLLLAQKAFVEGGLALVLYCASLVDRKAVSEDEDETGRLELLLQILTPIAKAWPAEFCLEANKHAIQVLGGYGYTQDHPVERLYRDNRLNAIHEGTNGIQAIDLLGRKVSMNDGAALLALTEEINRTINCADLVPSTRAHSADLRAALQAVLSVTYASVGEPDAHRALANAGQYLNAMGHLVVGWMWLRQEVAIFRDGNLERVAADPFLRGKTKAARYFFRFELPRIYAWLENVGAEDADLVLSMQADEF